MAKSRIFTFDGSIVLPTGFAMDCQTMRIHEMQNSENITFYGGGSYGLMFGSGTTMQDVAITGYPYKGVTASSPGFGAMNGTTGALGTSCVLTLDVGCTLTGTYLVDDLVMDHSRIVAGAKVSLAMKPGSDITVAWATS